MEPQEQSLIEITQSLHRIELQILEAGGELLLEANYKLQADKIYAIGKGFKTLSERLKFNLKQAMAILGVHDLEGASSRFKLVQAKDAVVIMNDGEIPLEFLDSQTVYTPNKERILEALKQGREVPGCLLEHSRTLRTYPVRKL